MPQPRRQSACGAGPTGSHRAGAFTTFLEGSKSQACRSHSGVAAVLYCNGAPTASCIA